MNEPIIIIDGDDVEIYLSVFDAQSDIEAIDAMYGGFIAYDSKGNILDISVENTDTVVISDPKRQQNNHVALANSIREYLKYIGKNDKKTLLKSPLNELVAELLVVYGFKRTP